MGLWWLIFVGVLAVAAAPFLATMAGAARVAGRPRREVRPAIAGPVWFMLATPAALTVLRWWRWNINETTTAATFAAASLGGAWAVWRLTRRANLTVGVVAWSAGAGPLFIFLESLTHGPYYIRSEALALLAAGGATAAAWHTGVFGVLILWARGPGRREARDRAGRCPNCGYDLRGLSGGVCPECGRPGQGSAADERG